MESGFVGVVDLDIFGWVEATGTYDYFTGTFNLEGFGRFNHHTLVMTDDSRVPPLAAGYCLTLGNRHKM